MDRFDSAFPSRQRRVGRWLQALLLTVLTTASMLTGIDVKAQTLTMSATPTTVCAGSNSTITATFNAAGINIGYAVNGVPPAYAFQAPGAGAVQLALDDDDLSAEQNVNAQFRFHGRLIDLNVDGFYVGSNGFITFRNAPLEFQIAPRNLALPGAGQTYDAIYLANTDLSPQLGGQIWYEVVGNQLRITFDDVPFFYPNPPTPITPNPATVSVQAILYLEGGPNAGQIDIFVQQIDDNVQNIQAAQDQHTIGLLSLCQPNPAATVGVNQRVGGPYAAEVYSWVPAAPALAPNTVDFYRCPTGVDCAQTGGTFLGSVGGVSPFNLVTATPASTSVNTYYYYAIAQLNNCTTLTSAVPNASVTANAQPVALGALTPATQDVCQGSSLTFTATPSIAGSLLAWSTTAPGATIITSGAQNQTAQITFPAGGTTAGTFYNISITETGPAPTNCSFVTLYSNRVRVFSIPTGPATAIPSTICVSSTGSVNVALGVPAAQTYAWSVTSAHPGTTGTLTFSNAAIQNPNLVIPANWAVQGLGAQTVTVQCLMGNGPGNLCTATASVNITVNPAPSVRTLTQSSPSVCVGTAHTYTLTGGAPIGTNTVSFSASGLAYTWQGGYVNGTFAPSLTQSIIWNAAGTGTINVTEQTVPAGCTRSYTINTTVNPLPTPSIVGANTPCQFLPSALGNPSFQTAPNPIQYTYTLNTVTLGHSYRWSITGGAASIVATAGGGTPSVAPGVGVVQTATPGNVDLNVSSITVQWTAAGARTVNVTERTAAGCEASSTLNVTVTATPGAGAFGIAGAGIAPSIVNICAAPGPGNVQAYNTSGPGTHTITVTGGTVTASAGGYVIGGGGSQVSGVGAVVGAFTVTWGAAGSATISDEYTDAGCAAVETYTLTINPNPTFIITGPPAPLCGNTSHIFSVTNLVNGGTPSYAWSEVTDVDNIGTLVNSGTANQSVTFLNPPGATSSYTVQCVVTNTTTGCATTVSQAFTITQVPAAPVITPVATACAASPQNPSSTTNYTITAAAGTLNVTLSGAPAGSTVTGNPFAHPGVAAPYTITWGQIAQNPALAPASVVVTINATITVAGCTSNAGTTNTTLYARPAAATLNTIPALCATSAVPVNVSIATNGGLGQPGVNYTWAAPGGGNVTLAGAGPSLTNQITALNGAGAKSIVVTATDAVSGCVTTSTTNFTVAPVPTPNISGSSTACQNLVNPVGVAHNAPFAFTYDYQTNLVAGNSYSWVVSSGFIVAYSTNNGGTWTNLPGLIANPASQTLLATVNASRIRVVFFGATNASVKVTETHPGGCGATTPDYDVTLNVVPTAYALGSTPQDVCNTGTQTAPLTLANSQVGYSYQVQRSTNGGSTWTNSAAAPQNGTGLALNFTVPTADLAYTTVAPAPTVYLFRVVATTIAPIVPAGCGPYVVSLANATVNVHSVPNAALGVTITPTPVCFGDLVNVTVAGSEMWVTYSLERAQIRNNSTGAPIAPVWAPTGISANGNGGNLLLADNTNPAGGFPLLANANYQYRVVATSNTNPPACAVTLTAQPTATVFALPQIISTSFTDNPTCWEKDVTLTYANTQDGVRYEVLRNGASMTPQIFFNGTGALGNATVTIPALQVQATNPAAPVVVNFTVRARLRSEVGAPYNRPVPASLCPVDNVATPVTVNPKPVAAITAPATACAETSTNFTANAGAYAATYDWKVLGTADGEPNNPPTGTAPLSATNTGLGTVNPFAVTWGAVNLGCAAGNPVYNPVNVRVRMIETNVFNCPDTAFHLIKIEPTVSHAIVSGPNVACIYGGFEEHLTTYSVALPSCNWPVGTTFLWTMPTGPVTGVIRSGQGTQSIVAEWTATGGTNIGQIQVAITLPAGFGGCTTVKTYNVTVYPQPQPVITGPTQVCQNATGSPTSTSIYTATLFTGDNYEWGVIGGTITTPIGASGTGVVGSPSTISAVNGNTITVTWGTSPNPNASITLTQTSVVGCINRTTLNVNVNPVPAPAINGPGTVCDNSVVTYSTANNAPTNTYQWNITAGNATITSGANQASATVLVGATGGTNTFTIQLTETTAATTCSKTVSRTINIVPTPAPVITRAGGNVGGACVNQTITYGHSDATVGTFSYKWTVVNGNIVGSDNAASVTVTWNTPGTGTLTLAKWHSSSQCTTTVSQNVNVVNPPAPAIAGPTVVCGQSTATYSTPAVAGNTYSWSFSNGTIAGGAGTNAISILWNNPVAGTTNSSTVTVTETNTLSGCAASASVNVTIRYQPQVQTITGPSQACAYNAVTNPANVNYSINPSTNAQYTWSITGGTIVSGQGTNAVAVRWTTVGAQTISVVERDATGLCSATSSLNVSVTYMPAPVISGNNAACTNTTETYSTPNVAGATYLWTIPGTAGVHYNAISGITSNSVTVQWLTSGTRTISVTETAGLCTATANYLVNVTTKPTPAISRVGGGNLNQACMDDVVSYSTAGTGNQFVWAVTGGTITAGQGTSQITVNWTAVGNQTVTVTETATANTACVGTSSVNVSVEERPNPVITGGTPVCSGTTQTYSVTAVPGHTYNWTISGTAADRTIVSSTTGNSVTVTWNNASTYTVSVTQTNVTGNCSASASLNVQVQFTPTATAISRTSPGGALNQACQGQTITYSTPFSGTSSYLWTATGGVINGSATGNTVSVTWQTIGNNTLTVTETTTGTPCFRTVSQNVAVSYTPTPNITGSTVVCINKEHTYSTPAVPGSTYNWVITPTNSFATIAGYPNSNAITVRWIQPGLHTMSVTETALGGFCFTTTMVNIRVNPIPTPDIQSTTGYGTPITARPGIVCNASTHTYSVTPTPGNVFQWVVTGGTITSGQNTNQITVLWGGAGTGTIACTETVPGSDCITTDRDTILIRPTPTPVVTGQINPCGTSVQDYTTPFVNGNTYTWTVVGGTFTSIAPNTIRVTWSSPVWPNTTAASVSVREDVAAVLPAGSCFGTNTLNVTIRPLPPTPTITGSAVVCATDRSDSPRTINAYTYTSSIPAIGAGSGSLTPNWTITGGTIVSGQGTLAVDVEWQNTGSTPITGTLTVTHTSSFGCVATSTPYTVTINPLPNPVISGPRSACQNSLQNYSTPGIPGNTYSWQVSGGNIIRAGQGTPNVTVEWTLPGAATLTVTEVNSFNCTVLNTIDVNVNALPSAVVTASGPTTFCQGGDVTLSAPLGFSSYVWNTGETARSIVVRTTGRYWVIVTDGNGCSNSSDTVQVNVFPSTLPIIAVSGPTTFCEGGSVTLTAPAGFGAYLWSNGATTQSITVTESGSYTVSVADNNGCTGTSTEVDVTVNPTPTPVLTLIGNPNLCSGDSVEVRAPAGYVSYTWVASSGTNYGTGRTIIIRQTDTVYCTVVDINGCVGSSDTVGVTMAPITAPVITANGPTTFCDGGAVTLTAPAGYASYIWSNGATGRTITVDEAGDYWVTVTNNATCPAVSAKTAVTVNELPAIPTISRMGDVLTANSDVATAWQWYRNGTVIAGANAKAYTVSLPGAYRVEIADGNTCASISDAFDVILTDVEEDVVAGRMAELRLSPNPSNGRFSIETTISQSGPVRIELVNAVGELVMTLNETATGGAFRTQVDMGTLAAGVYNVVVTSGSERWVVRMVRQ